MTHGNLAPYRRRFFGREGEFTTGSLVFDLERHRLRTSRQDGSQPRKTRLFPDL